MTFKENTSHLINRLALISGASEGIGLATSLLLAEAGAKVIMLSRSPKPLEIAVERVSRLGKVVEYHAVNVSDESKFTELAGDILARNKCIDILINNAGGDGVIKPILELSAEDWNENLKQNFFGCVLGCKLFGPQMKINGWGRIVNIASIAALQPSPDFTPYCVAKAAILTYSKALAGELARHNVTVNCISPGFVDTKQMRTVESTLASVEGCSAEEIKSRFENSIPLGRYADSEEVARLIAFLVSSGAGYITGSNLLIDGGLVRTT